jgi:hypothetical protein
MKNIETNTVYSFKLMTGEEIVAKITEILADGYVIEHPILTVISPQGLQMMPALFSSNLEQIVKLNNTAVVMVADTREDVRNSWIQATTGIAPVTKQIITG